MTNTFDLEIGRVVSWICCGGKRGVVVDVKENPFHANSNVMGGAVITGGSKSHVDIAWNDGSMALGVPSSVIFGVQWTVHDEVKDRDYVSMAKDFAEATEELNRLKAEKAKAEYDVEMDRIKADNPNLEPLEGSKYIGGVHTARNIRKELKASFKGVKFSVKSDYNCVRVYWNSELEGAPTHDEIKDVIGKYDIGYSNPMEDYHGINKTPWSDVFGGVEFLFIQNDPYIGVKEAA